MRKIHLLIALLIIFSSCKKYPPAETVDCSVYEKQTDSDIQGKWSLLVRQGGDTLTAANIGGNNQIEFKNGTAYLYKDGVQKESADYLVRDCGYNVYLDLPSFGSNGMLSVRNRPSSNYMYGNGKVNNETITFEIWR